MRSGADPTSLAGPAQPAYFTQAEEIISSARAARNRLATPDYAPARDHDPTLAVAEVGRYAYVRKPIPGSVIKAAFSIVCGRMQ